MQLYCFSSNTYFKEAIGYLSYHKLLNMGRHFNVLIVDTTSSFDYEEFLRFPLDVDCCVIFYDRPVESLLRQYKWPFPVVFFPISESVISIDCLVLEIRSRLLKKKNLSRVGDVQEYEKLSHKEKMVLSDIYMNFLGKREMVDFSLSPKMFLVYKYKVFRKLGLRNDIPSFRVMKFHKIMEEFFHLYQLRYFVREGYEQ